MDGERFLRGMILLEEFLKESDNKPRRRVARAWLLRVAGLPNQRSLSLWLTLPSLCSSLVLCTCC